MRCFACDQSAQVCGRVVVDQVGVVFRAHGTPWQCAMRWAARSPRVRNRRDVVSNTSPWTPRDGVPQIGAMCLQRRPQALRRGRHCRSSVFQSMLGTWLHRLAVNPH